MLERIWRKWNPCALLVGIKNSAALIANSMVVPQGKKKLEIKLPCDSAVLLLGTSPKEDSKGFISTKPTLSKSAWV